MLTLHLLIGLPVTLLSFLPPFKNIRLGNLNLNHHMQCWWARNICYIFGVKPKASGRFQPGPWLVVANHISWIDIQVLHSLAPMGFVAKAEIKQWPLAGWLASVGDTVFHHRGSHDSARGVSGEMSERLRAGRKVAIFAEGGILPGRGIKRFHARLFAAAIETGVPVQPVMLRYLQRDRIYHDITFLPGENFMANFFRLLRQPRCMAEVAILSPIETAGKQRRNLASESEQAITVAFHREPV